MPKPRKVKIVMKKKSYDRRIGRRVFVLLLVSVLITVGICVMLMKDIPIRFYFNGLENDYDDIQLIYEWNDQEYAISGNQYRVDQIPKNAILKRIDIYKNDSFQTIPVDDFENFTITQTSNIQQNQSEDNRHINTGDLITNTSIYAETGTLEWKGVDTFMLNQSLDSWYLSHPAISVVTDEYKFHVNIMGIPGDGHTAERNIGIRTNGTIEYWFVHLSGTNLRFNITNSTGSPIFSLVTYDDVYGFNQFGYTSFDRFDYKNDYNLTKTNITIGNWNSVSVRFNCNNSGLKSEDESGDIREGSANVYLNNTLIYANLSFNKFSENIMNISYEAEGPGGDGTAIDAFSYNWGPIEYTNNPYEIGVFFTQFKAHLYQVNYTYTFIEDWKNIYNASLQFTWKSNTSALFAPYFYSTLFLYDVLNYEIAYFSHVSSWIYSNYTWPFFSFSFNLGGFIDVYPIMWVNKSNGSNNCSLLFSCFFSNMVYNFTIEPVIDLKFIFWNEITEFTSSQTTELNTIFTKIISNTDEIYEKKYNATTIQTTTTIYYFGSWSNTTITTISFSNIHIERIHRFAIFSYDLSLETWSGLRLFIIQIDYIDLETHILRPTIYAGDIWFYYGDLLQI